MNKCYRTLIFIEILFCYRSGFATHHSLYSENGFVSQQNSLFSSTRIRTSFFENVPLKPFLQVGNELWSQKIGDGAFLLTPSYVYFGTGISWGLFQAFFGSVELRQRNYYSKGPHREQTEVRSTFQAGKEWQQPISKPISLVEEIYGEAVFEIRNEGQDTYSAFTRFGLRENQLTPLTFDLFLEPNYSAISSRTSSDSQFELRPSLRIRYFVPSFSVALNSALVFPMLTNEQTDPIAHQRKTAVRFIAVVGGEF